MKREYFGGLVGRSRGGINSGKNRKKNPDYYRMLGCTVSNNFGHPSRDNIRFAEFIGITLGDGGLTRSQLNITLNRVADGAYIGYVRSLISSLFAYTPSLMERKDALATVLTVSGIDFVNFLKRNGLLVGNKVRQQVGVPFWVQKNLTLATWCVRGLMDTDGCIFINRYMSNHKWYQYKKLAFANKSMPLLKFFYETLKKLGFHPIYYQNKQVRLCSEKETLRYLETVGSSNTRLLRFYA